MVDLLAKLTSMPVVEARHDMLVEANHVYFSLAADQGERAIGIVLSGTGSHGSLGIREINLDGGMVMAQQPDSAEYCQMPQSAIATGVVDYILPPEEMPAALVAFVGQQYLNRPNETTGETPLQSPEPKESEGLMLVTFVDHNVEHLKNLPQEMSAETPADAPAVTPALSLTDIEESPLVRQLATELKSTRDELQTTIEEMERSNEDLKTSNEEIMSMNEELQSANEDRCNAKIGFAHFGQSWRAPECDWSTH